MTIVVSSLLGAQGNDLKPFSPSRMEKEDGGIVKPSWEAVEGAGQDCLGRPDEIE